MTMTTELELAEMLDQFVDDINRGVAPQIYELMAAVPDAADDLIPLLDLIAQFKASTAQMPDSEKEKIKAQVLEMARGNPAARAWSIRRLIEESDPQVVAKSTALGLTSDQLDAVRSDTTPLNLEDPDNVNKVVAELANRHSLRFFDLLSWVRQLISSVLSVEANRSISMVYARDGEYKESSTQE
jgi:hypothetical protein